MQKRMIEFICCTLLPFVCITAGVLLVIGPVSCRATEEGLIFLDGDYECPKIRNFEVVSEREVKLDFTKRVTVSKSMVYSMQNDQWQELQCDPVIQNEETCLYIVLEDEMNVGQEYEIQGTVSDAVGNSLTFSIPFKGFNSRVPQIVISEVRNATGTSSINKVSHAKTEFVELFVLSPGNLSGLELYTASAGEKRKYVFPALEVQQGDYITVHLRKIQEAKLVPGEVMIDELEGNLKASTTLDCCDSAIDLWAQNESSCISSSDIVVLQNGNRQLLDALVFTCEGIDVSKKYPQLYSRIVEENLWNGEAFDTVKKTTATKSISRQNIQECLSEELVRGADQWILTADKGSGKNKVYGVTPGYANSNIPYEQ